MGTWLFHLGFIGEEFKTAREILTRRLRGDAAFRHTSRLKDFGAVNVVNC